MKRFLITALMLICTAGLLYAAGGTAPSSETSVKTRTLYLHSHKISNHYEKDFSANNHLVVLSHSDREMSFMITTISDENHECILEGKATRGQDGRYEYKENSCLLSFAVGAEQVDLDVKGSGGKVCRVYDLREGHGCGYNTSIDPGVYQKAKTAGPGTK